jgi:hypothetical protein
MEIHKVSPKPISSIRIRHKDVKHLRRFHGIEDNHINSISNTRAEEPGIMINFPDKTNVIADGNHRLIKRWELGYREMDFINFTEEEARLAELVIPKDIGESLAREGEKT